MTSNDLGVHSNSIQCPATPTLIFTSENSGIRMSESTKNNQQFQMREVLSVREMAKYLDLSESKIRQLINRNAIPYVKLDGQYRFYLPSIREWLQGICIEAKPLSIDTDTALAITNEIWKTTE